MKRKAIPTMLLCAAMLLCGCNSDTVGIDEYSSLKEQYDTLRAQYDELRQENTSANAATEPASPASGDDTDSAKAPEDENDGLRWQLMSAQQELGRKEYAAETAPVTLARDHRFMLEYIGCDEHGGDMVYWLKLTSLDGTYFTVIDTEKSGLWSEYGALYGVYDIMNAGIGDDGYLYLYNDDTKGYPRPEEKPDFSPQVFIGLKHILADQNDGKTLTGYEPAYTDNGFVSMCGYITAAPVHLGNGYEVGSFETLRINFSGSRFVCDVMKYELAAVDAFGITPPWGGTRFDGWKTEFGEPYVYEPDTSLYTAREQSDTPRIMAMDDRYVLEYLGEERGENGETVFELGCRSVDNTAEYLCIGTEACGIRCAHLELHGWYDFANDCIDENGFLYLKCGSDTESGEEPSFRYDDRIRLTMRVNDGHTDPADCEIYQYDEENYSGGQPAFFEGSLAVSEVRPNGEIYKYSPQTLTFRYAGKARKVIHN